MFNSIGHELVRRKGNKSANSRDIESERLKMQQRSFRSLVFASALSTTLAIGAIKTGPAVGEQIPAFSAPDQNGTMQTLSKIVGDKGAMLVFYRSADW